MKRTFPTAAAAWGSHTALCRIPARSGEHWLRGPVLRRRCGRRPMLSRRELSARAHIRRGAAFPHGADSPATLSCRELSVRAHIQYSTIFPRRAGPHTSLPRELHFSIFILQLRAAFEASFLFLASQNRETKQREKAAAHVRALKNRTGHYPPRNSRAEWKSSFRAISDYPTKSDARSDKRCG